ncbi:MAG TPA: DUF6101 family protein [Xanthobacteraceae bacterium]|nr:DUF6101 family protein [Xanthobacteraceae bacterium]
MRHQNRVDGGPPSGDGLRIDPACLPVRYNEPDAGADGGWRAVELFADRVVLRRRRTGIAMTLHLPMAAFAGIGVTLAEPDGDGDGVVLHLVHADPALCVRLYAAPDTTEVVAQWRRWCAVLAVPMLAPDRHGVLRPAFGQLGRLAVCEPALRRRRRGGLKHRRPSVFRRRAAGRPLVVRPAEGELMGLD